MIKLEIPLVSELSAQGKAPEVLFWVGCSGSFDPRAQRVVRAFAKILLALKIDFAVLGDEEQCTGDPARRSGNEFVFQMVALQNIETLNAYNIKKIVTACPHCFNIIKNEYPQLGGNYDVVHHTTFLAELIDRGQLTIKEDGDFKGKKVTYHDPCYLGRANGVYQAPRKLLKQLNVDLIEMKRSKAKSMCCGAGGAQMFKEEEEGTRKVNEARMKEIKATKCGTLALACPFCSTMLTDAAKEQASEMEILDISEMILTDLK